MRKLPYPHVVLASIVITAMMLSACDGSNPGAAEAPLPSGLSRGQATFIYFFTEQ